MAGFKKGQGATEYLVLAAVAVLIAMVAMTLLGGSFSGISDAKANQNQLYWRSVGPISITESSAGNGILTMNVKNVGNSPLSITRLVSGGGNFVDSSETRQIQPGDGIKITTTYSALAPTSDCLSTASSTGAYGMVSFDRFGFGYDFSISGNTISGTQVGPFLTVPCISPAISTCPECKKEEKCCNPDGISPYCYDESAGEVCDNCLGACNYAEQICCLGMKTPSCRNNGEVCGEGLACFGKTCGSFQSYFCCADSGECLPFGSSCENALGPCQNECAADEQCVIGEYDYVCIKS